MGVCRRGGRPATTAGFRLKRMTSAVIASKAGVFLIL